MEYIIIAVCLVAAAIYTGRSIYRTFKGKETSCGCNFEECPSKEFCVEMLDDTDEADEDDKAT